MKTSTEDEMTKRIHAGTARASLLVLALACALPVSAQTTGSTTTGGTGTTAGGTGTTSTTTTDTTTRRNDDHGFDWGLLGLLGLAGLAGLRRKPDTREFTRTSTGTGTTAAR
jgi:MYXO-CTERM domain-containing protein